MPIPVWVLLGFAAWTLQPTSAPAGAIILHPGDNISAIVKAAPIGATFYFEPGIYRGASIAPKHGQTFIGAEGAILNGRSAEKLDSRRQSLGHWCRLNEGAFTRMQNIKQDLIGRAILRLCSLTTPR